VYRLLGGRYPSLIAPTDSCVNPAISPHLRLYPRERSLCRLLSASAADGTFPTIFCESFLGCPSPYPGGSTGCVCLVLPQCHRPSLNRKTGRLPATFRERDFTRVPFRGCSYFVMFRPPSLLASQIAPTAASFPCRAAEAFSSKQNVRSYLRTHWIS
jgi:hypothetical protein